MSLPHARTDACAAALGRLPLRLAAVLATVAVLAGCGTPVRNPVTGETERTVMDERAEVAEGAKAHEEILKSAGAEIHNVWKTPARNHELGGARMGDDPRTSVTNKWGQTHDVPNLFLADGSVFPSASEKNPTHTIMALAARTADHIAERLRKGEL